MPTFVTRTMYAGENFEHGAAISEQYADFLHHVPYAKTITLLLSASLDILYFQLCTCQSEKIFKAVIYRATGTVIESKASVRVVRRTSLLELLFR